MLEQYKCLPRTVKIQRKRESLEKNLFLALRLEFPLVARSLDVTLECFCAGRLGRNVRRRSVCMPSDGVLAYSVNLSLMNV